MSALGRVSGIARAMLLALAIVISAIALLFGRATQVPQVSLQEGQPAPETYIANRPVSVTDEEGTAAARVRASAAVEDIYVSDPQVTETVLDAINIFFEDVRTAAVLIPQGGDDPGSITPPPTTTTTTSTTTTTTIA